jgi:hypothetical protein
MKAKRITYSSSESEAFVFVLLPDLIFDTEDGGDAFLRNVGGRLQN